jgi:hypothetical protein
MHKVTDVMLGYALRLALILVAGWMLVELVYSFHSTPKEGEHKEEQQRTPLSSTGPIQ